MKPKKFWANLDDIHAGYTRDEWLDALVPDFDETDVVDGSLKGSNKSDVIVLTAYAPPGPPVVSDFGFGTGKPFEGITVVDGVEVTLSSTGTEPFSSASFRDLTGPGTATVTMHFDAPISEFEISVSYVNNDEFLDAFTIGEPDLLTGDLVQTLDGVTTTRADDGGSGTLKWMGLANSTVSFEIYGAGAVAVDSFGIVAGSGVDVDAGNGKDHVVGSLFDDVIDGGNGRDRLFGDAGDDSLLGGNGMDKLDGGAGDDILKGGTAKDKLWGGAGDDMLYGGKSKDVLIGGEDNGLFSATLVVPEVDPEPNPGKVKKRGNSKHDDDLELVIAEYEVGDELSGGRSPDTFVYAFGDGVDVIRDLHRHDQIALLAFDEDEVLVLQNGDDSVIVFRDTDTSDPDDLLADAAIIVEGVDHLDTDDLVFA